MSVARTREARIAAELERRGAGGCRVALVLGSGLGGLVDRLKDPLAVPFAEIEGMPASRVPGHAGRFVAGELAGARVLVQQGRVHFYEGRSADEVTAAVRAFARLGVECVLLTNAAGAIAPEWEIPSLMRIEDHLSFQGVTPLRAGEATRGTPYDPEAGAILDAAAREAGVALQRGIYAATLGPAYESAAEIRLYARLGAHAVGMSTVAEASAAHVLGLRVAALSCLTNPAAGIAAAPLSHAEVIAAGGALAERFARLVTAALPRFYSSP